MAFLVMGSLNYDDNYFLDHIVMPGETIASQTMESACGGKGFNQAVALAKAGAEVYLAGLVGEADGERICQEARENGIKDTFLRKKEGYTGKAIIQIDQTGQNSIVLFGGANRQWTLEYVDKVLEHFQAEDILILFLLNEVEGGQMTGEKEPEKVLKRLQAKYPNAAFVLTYGEKGAWYVGNGETAYCPAKKVKVIDTTAAGDTFTGYFLSARGRGYGVEESLKKATAAAGEAVTRKGAAVSIPCWKELEEK